MKKKGFWGMDSLWVKVLTDYIMPMPEAVNAMKAPKPQEKRPPPQNRRKKTAETPFNPLLSKKSLL